MIPVLAAAAKSISFAAENNFFKNRLEIVKNLL